jgi:DNA invertase Pin-like site-specific DNA recombinase
LYARVSSQQQADAHTIASQVEALKDRICSDGFQLEEELCFFDEGYSGSTLFRPALERLRDQAAACSFDRLYVHSPDRLARAYAYQVLLVDELQRHGIGIVFLNRDIGQSPEDNLLLQMQGMMAEYERAKIMERSRRGKRHAAQVGLLSVLSAAPYGYRYLGKYEGGGQARYEIDEAQATSCGRSSPGWGWSGARLARYAGACSSVAFPAHEANHTGIAARFGPCSRTRLISGRPILARRAWDPCGLDCVLSAADPCNHGKRIPRTTPRPKSGLRLPCRPSWMRHCLPQSRSSWRRTAGGNGNKKEERNICCKDCSCAASAVMHTTANR